MKKLLSFLVTGALLLNTAAICASAEDSRFFDISSSGSTYAYDGTVSVDKVVDLRGAAKGTASDAALKYTFTVDADKIKDDFNSTHTRQISKDVNNDGSVSINAEIRINDDYYWNISAGSVCRYRETGITGYTNSNYLSFGDDTAGGGIISIHGSGTSATITIDTTLSELVQYAEENFGDESFVPETISISVEAEAYTQKSSGSHVWVDDSNRQYYILPYISFSDNHIRNAEAINSTNRIALKTPINIGDSAPDDSGDYLEPVRKDYTWNYSFYKSGGDVSGSCSGQYYSGSTPSMRITDIMAADPKNAELIKSCEGVGAMGLGEGTAYIQVDASVRFTYADGETYECEVYNICDETCSIVAPCIHSCSVCGLCTEGLHSSCVCGTPTAPAVTAEDIEASIDDENSELNADGVTLSVKLVDTDNSDRNSDFIRYISQAVDLSKAAAVYDISLISSYEDEGETLEYAYTPNEWGDMGEYVTIVLNAGKEAAAAVSSGEMDIFHITGAGMKERTGAEADADAGTITFTTRTCSPFVLAPFAEYTAEKGTIHSDFEEEYAAISFLADDVAVSEDTAVSSIRWKITTTDGAHAVIPAGPSMNISGGGTLKLGLIITGEEYELETIDEVLLTIE